MRLSEAMRLGAMLKPQAFRDSSPERSCALRAAGDALGFVTPATYMAPTVDLILAYPFLRGEGRCPVAGCEGPFGPIDAAPLVSDVVWHLNDKHRWTREQIADWVETVEARSTETTTAPVEDSAEILSVVSR